jgi:hypothetical protein
MSTISNSVPNSVQPEVAIEREPLPNADHSEPVLDTQHPFIAYKEVHRPSGAWRVRIQSRDAASALLYPNAIRLQARATSEQGKSSFTWTNAAEGNSGQSARIKFRVHVNDGEPAAIEVFPETVSARAGTAVPPVKFDWPEV